MKATTYASTSAIPFISPLQAPLVLCWRMGGPQPQKENEGERTQVRNRATVTAGLGSGEKHQLPGASRKTELCACLSSVSPTPLKLSEGPRGMSEAQAQHLQLLTSLPGISAHPGLLRKLEKVKSQGHPFTQPMGCLCPWPSHLCEEKGSCRDQPRA